MNGLEKRLTDLEWENILKQINTWKLIQKCKLLQAQENESIGVCSTFLSTRQAQTAITLS
jgi:hypothetical protein